MVSVAADEACDGNGGKVMVLLFERISGLAGTVQESDGLYLRIFGSLPHFVGKLNGACPH